MSTDLKSKLRWFTGEFLVVVSGVLVALALNAWVQGLSDARKEHAYLEQMLDDLTGTEADVQRLIVQAETEWSRLDTLLSFFDMQPPPTAERMRAFAGLILDTPAPRSGTARALVETGDLNLLSNDSLKSAIVSYADFTRNYEDERRRMFFDWLAVNFTSMMKKWPFFVAPTHPFSIVPTDLLRDRDFFLAVTLVQGSLDNLLDFDQQYLAAVQDLKTAVESELQSP